MDWRLPEGVTRLVLIRHGAPSEEVVGRCYGHLDIGLSAVGHAQAKRLSVFLAEAPLDALYVSPLRRAQETASALKEGRGTIEAQLEPALRELSFGMLEGLTYSEVSTRFPELYAKWMSQPEQVIFPGGESFLQLAERVKPAVRALRMRHEGRTLALVSHGGVNRVLLADALNLPAASLFRLDQGHCSVNVVDYWGDTPLVRLMNAVP